MAYHVAIHPNRDRGTMKDPCFWISNHLTHIPYSYCHTLQKLHTDIKNKHQDKLNEGLILLHDNVPPCHRLQDEVNAMLLQGMLHYPTYSPDLTHTIFTSLDQLRKPSKAPHTHQMTMCRRL